MDLRARVTDAVSASFPPHPSGHPDGSGHTKLLRAAVVVGVLTVAVKTLGIAKELLLAARFGTAPEIDLFFVAFIVPTFFLNLIGGSLQSALLPCYVRLRERREQDKAVTLLGNVTAFSGIVLVGTVAALALLADPILAVVAPGMDAGARRAARPLFLLLVPATIAGSLGMVWASAVNAQKRFFVLSVLPALNTAVPLLVLALAGPSIRLFTLASSAGFVVEALAFAWALRRSGDPVTFRLKPWLPEASEALRQVVPLLFASLLVGGAAVVNQAMATLAGPGQVAALNYGTRNIQFLAALAATALGNAAFPFLAESAAQRNTASLREIVRRLSLVTVVGTLPIAVTIIALSVPITRVLFERGSFLPADTIVVARIQAYAALQIPLYLLGIVLVRLISAMGQNRILFRVALLSLLLNAAGNWILMRPLGTAGIALSSTIAQLASLVFLAIATRGLLARAAPDAESAPDRSQ